MSSAETDSFETEDEYGVPPLPSHDPTIPALLRWCLRQFGDTELVVTDQDVSVTYGDVDRESRTLAKQLVSAGIGKGTRVAAQFPYGPEWIVTWLAVSRIGAIYIPFSTAYKPRELREALRHSDAAMLLAPLTLFGSDRTEFYEQAIPELPGATAGRLRLSATPYLRAIWVDGAEASTASWMTRLRVLNAPGPAVDDIDDRLLDEIESEITPADLALAVYTSGTSGKPKGVLHTHGALTRKASSLAWYLRWTSADRVFCGMPFFWIGGVGMTVLPAMSVGATLLCAERTTARRSLDLIVGKGATQITGWPAVTAPLLALAAEEGTQLPLRPGQPGAANTGVRGVSSLGMTETIASHTFLRPGQPMPEAIDPEEPHGACVGPALCGMEHRIVDPETGDELPDGTSGALLVRGYALTAGLIKREREEVFTKDGWYNTGDHAYLRNGNLYLLGRLSEMIKTSGNNVDPAEVESVLLEFPEIHQAFVAGVPDPERSEIVAAMVVLNSGCELAAEEIRERARSQLSNYKVPRFLLFRDAVDVPWLPSGKADRLGIKAGLADAYRK